MDGPPKRTHERVDPSLPLPPELDPRGRRAARKAAAASGVVNAPSLRARAMETHVHRGVVLGVKIVAAALSVTFVLLSGFAWLQYRDLEKRIKRLHALSGKTSDFDGKDQNILLVGNDNRETATDAELKQLGTGRDGGSLATDTMMVIHVPADRSKAVGISFPRDTWVDVPGQGMNKLNGAYAMAYQNTPGDFQAKAQAGSKLLIQTIENLTDLKIDHYVQVDLLGFYRISNAIGGVAVNLCHAVRGANFDGETGDYIDSGYENGSFVANYTGITLKQGWNSISGLQALAFVRQRHGLPKGDLDRIHRQQYFLSQAFKSITSAGVLLNPRRLQTLVDAVVASVVMDETMKPLELASQLSNLSADKITFETIHTTGADENGLSIQRVDPAEVQSYVRSLINPPVASATTAPKSVTVQVWNGAGRDGAAADTAEALRRLGFQVSGTRTADQAADRTVVLYPPGQKSQADAVATRMPGVEVQEDANVSQVTLLLGQDDAVKALGNSKAAPSTGTKQAIGATATTAPKTVPAPAAKCVN